MEDPDHKKKGSRFHIYTRAAYNPYCQCLRRSRTFSVQDARLLSYAGRAHLFIHSISNTLSIFGRSLGLHDSIDFNMSRNLSLSSSPIVSMPRDCLGSWIHCSKRLSQDQMSHSLLRGFPASSNHCDLFSQFFHHSDGKIPCK